MRGRLGLGCVVVAACGPHAVFVCDDASDCVDGAEAGICEPNGWCSFADAICPSRRRYGRWSGDGLASTCVPPTDAGSTSAGATGPDASTTETGAPPTSDTTTHTTSDGSGSSTLDATSSGSSTGGDVPAALVAWYPFETVMDGVVIDAQGMHDGSCEVAACPTIEPGIVGNGARFDGVDDVVRVADHPDLHTEAGVTLAAWISMDPMVSGFRCVIAKPLATTSFLDSWELARSDPGTATMAVADGTTVTGAHGPLSESGWRHLAGSWDGAAVRLYVDGALVATEPADAIAFTALDTYIGASLDDGAQTNFFAGVIDELRVYRGALGDAEIAALAVP